MGVVPEGEPVAADWLADPAHWESLRRRLAEEVARHAAADPLDPGLPVEAARSLLDLPDRRLVDALARPPLRLESGRVHASAAAGLPPAIAEAVQRLRADLDRSPFRAPEADRLAELGLTGRALGAAVRAGALLKIAEGIVLLPGADTEAVRVLASVPQPFTVSEARRALDTSRRVAVPLLEHLDRQGLTTRVDDARRTLARVGRSVADDR
jgi:selenocysteine-specific elongation factor